MEWIVSLTPDCAAEPLEALSHPPDGAALVELRLDLFPDLVPREAVAACPVPLLVTLRSTDEGGRGPVDPVQREHILRAARDAGAALVDLEFLRDGDLITRLGLAAEQIVLSTHNLEATPTDIGSLSAALHESAARWVKVVCTVNSLRELETVLSLHGRFNSCRRSQRRLITFGMGSVGIPSRLLAPLIGPPISYAAWNSSAPAAPGQLSVAAAQSLIGHLNGLPQRLFGVVGRDVSRSLSPAMHSAAYGASELYHIFIPVCVPDPAELPMLFAPRGQDLFAPLGLSTGGWAVTTPYKRQAAEAATLAAPRVIRAGAANTLLLKSNQIIAENTDADGVVAALRSVGLNPWGATAVVQGTGGAARGAAVGLHLAGVTVFLRGRDANRSRAVAEQMDMRWCEPDESPPSAQILVNATPLGGSLDDSCPFSEDEIEAADAVLDMVYADQPTRLVELAEQAQTPAVDGRDILAFQGYSQFAAFTGRLPPKQVMRAALGRVRPE